eukprot:5469710-Lingulodinium_polyedra.AAC.1
MGDFSDGLMRGDLPTTSTGVMVEAVQTEPGVAKVITDKKKEGEVVFMAPVVVERKDKLFVDL